MSRRRRTEDLASVTLVRRSPRLSSRPPIDPSIHTFSRPSLSRHTNRRRSKSRSPSAILNESGQSVPVTFEDAPDNMNSSHGEGMPHHLYGLDSDGVGGGGRKSPEPNRLWNMYDKERVFVTSAPLTHEYDDAKSGFFTRVVDVCTSLLFKLGSFIYLAAAAILCLDVIMLHRLFNFASLSQRAGSISRFLFLLLPLICLVTILLGGQIFPSTPAPQPVVPPVYIPPVKPIPPTGGVDLDSLRAQILESISVTLKRDLQDYEARSRESMEAYLNSLMGSMETRLRDKMRESLEAESEKTRRLVHLLDEKLSSEINTTIERHVAGLRRIIDSGSAGSNAEFETNRRTVSSQIEEMKNTQSRLSNTVQLIMDDIEGSSRLLKANMSEVQGNIKKHDERLFHLEKKQRQILEELSNFKATYLGRIERLERGTNGTVSGAEMSSIFNEELNKAVSDKDSALRLWLDVIFASKDDVQAIQQQIDNLQARIREGGVGSEEDIEPDVPGVTRKDIEDLIDFSLRKYSADRIGKFDFALESSGGGVMLDRCSPTFTHSVNSISLFGVIPLWHVTSTPKVIIQPSLYPGNCWAMEGQSGYATIKLRDEVVVTGVTVDHIPSELSPNGTLDTAPKEFAVSGLTALDQEPVSLGTFSYDLTGTPIQEFTIEEKGTPFHFIKFEVLSNYGSHDYTCVYRVRVHGHYP